MLHSVLWLGFVMAGVSGLTALIMTQSVLLTLLAYSGAGMAVLIALLVADMIFGAPPSGVDTEDTVLATGPRA